MSDLIRREDVITVLCFCDETKMMLCGNLRKILEKIDAIPSAEPERKKGEWVEYPDCLRYEGAYADYQIVCSECHHVFCILDNCTEEFDFCPHCGADMRGDQ